jgi:hypothetical protein
MEALASILHLGLVAIRNDARKNPEYAFVEGDHSARSRTLTLGQSIW